MTSTGDSTRKPGRRLAGRGNAPDLVPREFLRAIAVWSLIPAYLLAGGFLGWLVDSWFHSSPYGVGAGLIIALAFAVKDMLRLRDEM
jgi:hypothetical protein